MFPPPRRVPPSVQLAGVRDPTSSVEFNRRANIQGVIDLTQDDGKKKKKRKAKEYSTASGHRQKQISTTNLSSYAITMQERWSEGAFRWVHKGYYAPNPAIYGDTGGPQNGELCVLKEFKSGSVYENSFFDNDIKAVDKAAEFIAAFNASNYAVSSMSQYKVGQKLILLNTPQVWESVHPDSTGRKSKKLVEPMLEGEFLKFNSNSGYVSSSDFMQALSHFSYHHSGGQFLLCDLQGGHYHDAYVLTDPVVMSSDNTKRFGVTDLGSEGISNFFAHHKCTCFCQSTWMKPSNPRVSSRIPRLASTSMSLEIGTRESEADRRQKLDAILAKTERRRQTRRESSWEETPPRYRRHSPPRRQMQTELEETPPRYRRHSTARRLTRTEREERERPRHSPARRETRVAQPISAATARLRAEYAASSPFNRY